jgi:hypothetical protein
VTKKQRIKALEERVMELESMLQDLAERIDVVESCMEDPEGFEIELFGDDSDPHDVN